MFWPRVEAVVSADLRLHHDNAPTHTSAVATAKLVELGYELLPHPPYSPYLAQPDRNLSYEIESVGRHGGLLCRPPENVFFRWVKEVGASLGQVYRSKRRLCWEIHRHFSKIVVFLLQAKYLSDRPRIHLSTVNFSWWSLFVCYEESMRLCRLQSFLKIYWIRNVPFKVSTQKIYIFQ